MSNPFFTSKLETLKEAFPSFDIIIISNVLDSVKGNTEAAAEALLNMSNTTHYGPQLPNRQNIDIPERNPFMNRPNPNPRPPSINIHSPNLNIRAPSINIQHPHPSPRISPPTLNVRQDLALWREQLAQEGRERRHERRHDRRNRHDRSERSRSFGSSQQDLTIRNIAMEGKQAALETASAMYEKMVTKYNIESNSSLNALQNKLERVRSSIPAQPISTLRESAQRSISGTLVNLQNKLNTTVNQPLVMNSYQNTGNDR
ncbi:hypothetical protein CLU79DRAFT_759507 [Phycomyces nitens]|nr:hypothetical protein CLU79DRAFT_759507 [Phycomyces nitens]